MADRHHRVPDTGWQGVPLAHDRLLRLLRLRRLRRLLRRLGGQLDHRYAPRRRSSIFDLVNAMLDAAIERVASSNDRPVVHSDRGGHYRWPGWLSRMDNAKLKRLMSRKGCSPDNAACEGFFGRLKKELFYPRNWQATTIDQFI